MALKGLNTIDMSGSPTNIGKFKTGLGGAYMKDNTYRMEFTRGHVERTTLMSHIIQEPFKNNSLSFESTRKMNLSRNLFKNKLKTAKMKSETI